MYTVDNGKYEFHWDPKNLEIRTVSVEKILEPLVYQVTTLVSNGEGGRAKKKGCSKRAEILVAAVEKATSNFIETGAEIAVESEVIGEQMSAAVQDVRRTGESMSAASRAFADDPCSTTRRAHMVRASRHLLSAVTRLLILADMVDVYRVVCAASHVRLSLEAVCNVNSQSELVQNFGQFHEVTEGLLKCAGERQHELKDPALREGLAEARALLKKHTLMLFTSSKTYIRHPELADAKSNRDFAYRQIAKAVECIETIVNVGANVSSTTAVSAAQETHVGGPAVVGPMSLATALDSFDERVTALRPVAGGASSNLRPSLEEQLELIISPAALVADSSCTRDQRRERIVYECNAVRQALQDLLTAYLDSTPTESSTAQQPLHSAAEHILKKSADLRRSLRKAVIDHVSDVFLDTVAPLSALVEAAAAGSHNEMKSRIQEFEDCTSKLIEVARLACGVCANINTTKHVLTSVEHLQSLCPQVINAANILVERPKSKVAQENMDVFRVNCEQQIKCLMESVDSTLLVDDYLAVVECHILDDMNRCLETLHERQQHRVPGDLQTSRQLERLGLVVGRRVARACDIVLVEMENYDACVYKQNVVLAVDALKQQIIPNFVDILASISNCFKAITPKEFDENEFIDVARSVYDGVRELRRVVLLNRSDDELDPEEVEFDEYYALETRSRSSAQTTDHVSNVDEYPEISGISTARDAMRKLNESDKEKIVEQVEYFRTEKRKFDAEVAKWDESGNDIIVMAKQMCMIMMEMTDFTRGRGPLKTTMDVIGAAKRISEVGSRLDQLARQIADQCPESCTKKDLLAYMQRISLYTHQLNITSKVKADVQNISGELIVSGLDSATSLIQAAKNLMNTVVVTVKASYVASTKYRMQRNPALPLVVWRMKAPEKKPLVRCEPPEEVDAKVRKGYQRNQVGPISELEAFHSPVHVLQYPESKLFEHDEVTGH